MGANGNILADFGPFPGQSDVVVAVTGQAGILAGSDVEAWIEPAVTAAGFQSDGYPFDSLRRLTRGANLTGAVSSNQWIFSCWFRQEQFAILSQLFGDNSANSAIIFTTLATPVNFWGDFSGNATAAFDVTPSMQVYPGVHQWHQFLASGNGSTASSAWVDDVLVGKNFATNAPLFFSTATDWAIGGRPDAGDENYYGAIAEVYFADGQFLDFTVQANRRKFNQVIGDGTLRPIDLGATGSNPTGAQPRIYLHMDHGADPATFLTNNGSGGNFSRITGSAPIAGQALPLCVYPGHSADEHEFDIEAKADKSSIVAGTGFNIRVRNTNPIIEPLTADGRFAPPLRGGAGTRLCGKYNIGYAWN